MLVDQTITLARGEHNSLHELLFGKNLCWRERDKCRDDVYIKNYPQRLYAGLGPVVCGGCIVRHGHKTADGTVGMMSVRGHSLLRRGADESLCRPRPRPAHNPDHRIPVF